MIILNISCQKLYTMQEYFLFDQPSKTKKNPCINGIFVASLRFGSNRKTQGSYHLEFSVVYAFLFMYEDCKAAGRDVSCNVCEFHHRTRVINTYYYLRVT